MAEPRPRLSEDWLAVWIGLAISWVFFQGVKPPVIGG